MTGRAAPRRRAGPHARKPGPRLRQRARRVLPRGGRIAALLLAAVLAGGLMVLLDGPWLRVARIAWSGEQYTPARDLQTVVAGLQGTALLAVDATGLSRELESLPAIAEARVDARLPDAIQITIVEKVPTFVWQTIAVRLIGTADGTIIGQLARDATLPAALIPLPFVDDQRNASRDLTVGDQVDAPTLAAALRLVTVTPASLGSRTARVGVRLTDDDGFLLVSHSPDWKADFGFYAPLEPMPSQTLEQRVSEQVAAVRTLFSTQAETGVSWVDVRDPGRVYWRP